MYIELKNICKSYGDGKAGRTEVLRHINLSVEKGEMLAIKGPSGSGKSTLLHILGCLDMPESGTYRMDGDELTGRKLAALAGIRNNKIGFVMQHFALIDSDSAIENVMIPMLFSREKVRNMEQIALRQLTLLNIGHLAKKRAGNLSGGEKQRVAIARALVNDPDLILADEPTGALDRENTEAVMSIFRELNSEGKTVIIVTHDDYVAGICGRVISIRDGVAVCND